MWWITTGLVVFFFFCGYGVCAAVTSGSMEDLRGKIRELYRPCIENDIEVPDEIFD